MLRKSLLYLPLLITLALAPAACDSSSPTTPPPVPCSYSLSPTSLTFGAAGGSNSVTVTAASNARCS